jgi:peptidoglycan-N-acetylglucosamine deacetylase
MLHALSIDLESYLHAELLRRYVDRRTADPQLEAATQPMLALLAAAGVRATFFVVGEVLELAPELVQQIAAAGHEVACHSYSHRPLWELDRASFRAELSQHAALMARLGLPPAVGYRAPTFSLSQRTAWALEELAAAGFRYDSSVFPRNMGMYGVGGAPLAPYRPDVRDLRRADPRGPILEFPMAVWPFLGVRLPVAGGAYLRAWPFFILRAALRRIQAEGRPFVLYVHPWEGYPATPRVPGLSPLQAWGTYTGRRAVLPRLRALLAEFEFAPIREVLGV